MLSVEYLAMLIKLIFIMDSGIPFLHGVKKVLTTPPASEDRGGGAGDGADQTDVSQWKMLPSHQARTSWGLCGEAGLLQNLASQLHQTRSEAVQTVSLRQGICHTFPPV